MCPGKSNPGSTPYPRDGVGHRRGRVPGIEHCRHCGEEAEHGADDLTGWDVPIAGNRVHSANHGVCEDFAEGDILGAPGRCSGAWL